MSTSRRTVSQLFDIPETSYIQNDEISIGNEIAHGKFGTVFVAEVKKEFDIPRVSLRPSLQPPLRQSLSVIQAPPQRQRSRPSNTVYLFEKSKIESEGFDVPLSRQSIVAMERQNGVQRKRSQPLSPINTVRTYNQKLSVSTKPEKVAMKTQIIKKPRDFQETSYAECRIFKALAKLMTKRYCNNFIYMYQWFKSFVNESERQGDSEQKISFIMEYAEMTFAKRKSISKRELFEMQEVKEIIFQVIWALMIGQKELSFMHNDLHANNIMINKAKKDHYYFNPFDNSAWKTSIAVVKICDFGSSRIQVDGEIIGKGQELFDEYVDRLKFCESLQGFNYIQSKTLNEDKKLLTDFKKYLKNIKGTYWGLGDLLYHPFFDSLRVQPKFTKSMSVYSYKFEHPLCPKTDLQTSIL
ncbi:protein kinase domain containing protein [Entamoeba histolytica HM-1:IMSS-B]|uniref:Protein kinase domain containing protein n=6 Tax=Entamoeba histolytica TaxID=5759 RepID=C4M627_ENTH1|nr:protein kinase domain containing protein [Entamoeba histolytica HM-1:IMSS]EMD45779.1 protein kinase domain containing protein [Entamoeba histolytica KU27]EMH78007.1 protein kinase domain containing protein [Entamoeba histolytica HM-1:IMSS-B]EMS16985.1 protein kinase domain containing protein [Entamoeba histolytica HM-3:IMSS]ENY62321.1 protein kinase domain containing protein [Entamoeba histolytica HM-1:IMSS-A]GAT96908.1 protein kinase domain containing protein [Entamoeba histolytica]|eukprot:XP_653747.1 protein kinase domain containing protein [Entamoeba histolytica HM-1:IMSS]